MAHLLVIEDDRAMRAVIRQMLEGAGHEVCEAADGIEALALFRARPSDLVITDLYMPEKSGWETLRELHRLAPALPFVVISGGGPLEGLERGTTGVLETGRRSGACRWLRKPFARQELTDAVDALLGAVSGRGPGA